MSGFKITNDEKEYSIIRSIRIKEELLNKLEEIAYKHDISTNKLIIKCIEYALDNMEEDTEGKENSN
jgi:predicted HicB family RNase H-like nuclease